MKLNDFSKEQLIEKDNASFFRRFISSGIDFILIALCTLLFSFISLSICTSSSSYQTTTSAISEEISYFKNYIEETHLVEFYEGTNQRKDGLSKARENLYKSFYTSYLLNEEKIREEHPDFTLDSDSVFSSFGTADFTYDDISYFYTVYIPLVQGKEEHPSYILEFKTTPEDYVLELYKNSLSELLDFGYSFPVLKAEVSYDLFIYLTEEKDFDNTAYYNRGENYYSIYTEKYSSLLDTAEELCLKDEPYYSKHYLVYRAKVNLRFSLLAISVIIAYVFAYLLLSLITKIAFKYERTLGRKVMSLACVDREGGKPKWYFTLIEELAGLMGYFLVTLFALFLPPINFSYQILVTPIFSSVSYGVLIIVFSVLACINEVFTLFFTQRQTLLEKIFSIHLKDLRSD